MTLRTFTIVLQQKTHSVWRAFGFCRLGEIFLNKLVKEVPQEEALWEGASEGAAGEREHGLPPLRPLLRSVVASSPLHKLLMYPYGQWSISVVDMESRSREDHLQRKRVAIAVSPETSRCARR